MGLLDMFRARPKPSAQVAKERLQILIAHERRQGQTNAPEYLPRLQADLLAVIRKYVSVEDDAVKVQLDHNEGMEILELNITLPERGEDNAQD